jgi:hypothetical protein
MVWAIVSRNSPKRRDRRRPDHAWKIVAFISLVQGGLRFALATATPRPLPRPIIIPDLLTLEIMADVRVIHLKPVGRATQARR